MRLPRLAKTFTVLAVAAVGVSLVVATLSTPAEGQRRVQWKMASAFGSKVPHLGTSALRFVDNVKVMSGGRSS